MISGSVRVSTQWRTTIEKASRARQTKKTTKTFRFVFFRMKPVLVIKSWYAVSNLISKTI